MSDPATILAGAKVLVTRRYEDSRKLSEGILRLGGEVTCVPMIEVLGPLDRESLALAQRKVGGFDWLVFTSRHSAGSFLEGVPVPEGSRPRVAAVGGATAAQVRERGWPVDLQADGSGAAALATALIDGGEVSGKTFVYPCSNLARTEFATMVMDADAAGVLTVEAYRVVRPVFAEGRLEPGDHDVVVFASPSAVSHMAQLLEERGDGFEQMNTVSIGPTTTEALRASGVRRIFEATNTDHRGLLDAIVAAWAQHIEGRKDT